MKRISLGKVTSYGILIISSFASLFPLFWTFSTSIKNRTDTYVLPPKFFNFHPTLKNYISLFKIKTFPHIYLNSIFITLMSTLISLILGSLSAYAFARRSKFRGRTLLDALMIAVRALPAIVVLLPIYKLSSYLGMYDSVWTLILLYAGFNIPFAIWLLTSFFNQIPIEIEEAARVDGASNTRMFVQVILPLAAPGLVATGIFISLLSWNEFLIPVIMAGENAKTLPVFVASFISNKNLDWGPMAAAATVAMVPIVALTVFIQRWLVTGLSSGAVKD
ncbi:MAG: carbohydrate ABC transporter permease [Actinobacteria bacterium]|nr:carbohydrate ABC transporter permease [Actinomycetota bacterium]NDH13038.1 carbohydrate ABC transporter permease [Actinomycetota bacterium]